MNAKAFFDAVRAGLGDLSQGQVDGFNILLAEAQKRSVDKFVLPYILATAWWESGKTMQPVREAFYISKDFAKAEAWRKKNLRYYPYYGRGYVQLTWDYNYTKASKALGVDFVKNPDAVMEPANAATTLFEGMEQGWFTGKKVADYIDQLDESDVEDLREFEAARHVVNGTDKAAEIGRVALVIEKALHAADYGVTPQVPQAPVETPKPVPATPTPPAPKVAPVSATASAWGRLFASILALIKKVL